MESRIKSHLIYNLWISQPSGISEGFFYIFAEYSFFKTIKACSNLEYEEDRTGNSRIIT